MLAAARALLLISLAPAASRGNTCNQLAASRYVRCGADPLYRAGQFHSGEGVFEISVGDPDVQYDTVSQQWHAWWSTGLATSYAAANGTMGIKHAVSPDGVKFAVRREPVLRTAASPTAWDYTKAETPTVVRLPSAIRTPERQWVRAVPSSKPGHQLPDDF
eukprot:SAG31_NODE_2801_length_5073_cov_12.272618_1_plen_161_part_00